MTKEELSLFILFLNAFYLVTNTLKHTNTLSPLLASGHFPDLDGTGSLLSNKFLHKFSNEIPTLFY